MIKTPSSTQTFRAGLDVGSTTAKIVLLDPEGRPFFSLYRRHGTDIPNAIKTMLGEIDTVFENPLLQLSVTGSAGIGIAERAGFVFVQEVIAAGEVVRINFPDARTLIDIGGEDSKMLFFSPGASPDIRMNGSCAGGTGAFIDQMASVLGVSLQQMNSLAADFSRIYPIASRCGVFAKTDVQNLVSRKISLNDICASIFHAVVMQNLNSLARGAVVEPGVVLSGGPLTFLSGLRTRLIHCLGLASEDFICPLEGGLLPAWGAALGPSCDARPANVRSLLAQMMVNTCADNDLNKRFPPLFTDQNSFNSWEKSRHVVHIPQVDIGHAEPPFFLGVDCGSTTAKMVVTDRKNRVLFHDYRANKGNPVEAVVDALKLFRGMQAGRPPVNISAGGATGYGEDLIRAALGLDMGVVETLAHRRSAVWCLPGVSFLLDIGGQDMKALFFHNEKIERIDINEACSSGCGSFIEGLAGSMGLSVEDFAKISCLAPSPCDLGTRCTVFMNSSIKQAQRENANINDIAAGLAYSVIKNSLHKVLKLQDPSQLGDRIVVQGGAFRNSAVLRAFEILTGRQVVTSNFPELMGAYGVALMIRDLWDAEPGKPGGLDLSQLEAVESYSSRTTSCNSCENQCSVTIFDFGTGRRFFTGNKCERIFSNRGKETARGVNLFAARNAVLFNRNLSAASGETRKRIGIPRILGMYEEFPFWYELFTGCGFQVVLSDVSTQMLLEKGIGAVMSDNICFPARLAHGHIADLMEKNVDRVFYPMVIFETPEKDSANSYNCPIVACYSDVLKGTEGLGKPNGIQLDAPPITFQDEHLLRKTCRRYMKTHDVPRSRFNRAFAAALSELKSFREDVIRQGKAILNRAEEEGRVAFVLAGRPYHVDPLIEHETSGILADLGVDVIPCDVAAAMCDTGFGNLNVVAQWSFPNRLLKAARWVAGRNHPCIQFVMLNSFGCGPDAFIMDEIRDLLHAAGKTFTLIKIDEISSVGSVRLRLRSLVEALKSADSTRPLPSVSADPEIVSFSKSDIGKPILGPDFADCYTPFFSPVFKLLGYDLRILPPSDRESVEYGLRYANNEICFPATVIIGDFIKAFKSGLYDPEQAVVGMTQTGGQCRATSYLSMIRRGLAGAGYRNVPVVSFTAMRGLNNDQGGFRFDFRKIAGPAFAGLQFADAIARMFYKSVVREILPGQAIEVRDCYLELGSAAVEAGNTESLPEILRRAVEDFNGICREQRDLPRIGIVGEIFVKYNRFSQMRVVDWLISRGVEVSVPSLTDFALKFFVNMKVNRTAGLRRGGLSILIEMFFGQLADSLVRRFEKVLAGFRFYEPSPGIYQKAGAAADIVNLVDQFGEGWLIPAEIAGFARERIWDVVCLQPFGCIANHVVGKGIERRVKRLYPKVNLLYLDFDAGASEVNILNRLHFVVDNARRNRDSIIDRIAV